MSLPGSVSEKAVRMSHSSLDAPCLYGLYQDAFAHGRGVPGRSETLPVWTSPAGDERKTIPISEGCGGQFFFFFFFTLVTGPGRSLRLELSDTRV